MNADSVEPNQLQVGQVYFKVDFVDRQKSIPRVTPVVFAGRDLDGSTRGDLFFQDYESYRRGAGFDSGSSCTFEIMSPGDCSGVCELAQAIRCLEQCADLRRD